jgi:hypothetical protein
VRRSARVPVHLAGELLQVNLNDREAKNLEVGGRLVDLLLNQAEKL